MKIDLDTGAAGAAAPTQHAPATSPWRFGARGHGLADSVIRALTKRIAGHDGIISFAGGMPSPLTFPVDAFSRALETTLRQDGQAALQYGPSDGHLPLRDWIAQSLSGAGRRIHAEQVVITSGSQQGLDLLGKVMLDPGDAVAVETPTYLGALQALGLYGPRFVPLASDAEGLVPEALDAAAKIEKIDMGPGCKLLYTIPTFQNPTGRTLTLARREAIVATSLRHRMPIVEDDPYGALDYAGRQHTPLLQLGDDNVAYLGSFSKVLSPGIRIGYVVAPQALARKIELAKQASDLHTSSLMQRVVFEIVSGGFMDAHLRACRALYGGQAQAMARALEQHFTGLADWTVPEGGMFMWLALRGGRDATALLENALAAGVAYVPGAPFFAEHAEANTLRLCLSTTAQDDIATGIARLAQVLRAPA